MSFIPSEEQQAIFDAVLAGKGNVAISALAGTGKTTVLVELAKRLPQAGSKLFCAFNKSIVYELEQRLKGTGMTTKTFHGLGYAALAKELGVKTLSPDGLKYKQLISTWATTDIGLQALLDELAHALVPEGSPLERDLAAADAQKHVLQFLRALLDYTRIKLVDWEDTAGLLALVRHYQLDSDLLLELSEGLPLTFDLSAYLARLMAHCIAAVPALMQASEKALRDNAALDFTDMIYWIVRWDVSIYQYTWVFIDEVQDLNPMQRAMVAKAVFPRGGRVVAVGDPHQSIYAFGGADSDSFDLTVAMFNCRVLPMTLTRRCARVVVEHAAQLVPSFRGLAEKPRGKIVWLPEERLVGVAQKGDMILSRVKAPLVAACLNLIAAGIPATIIGSDIGKQLIGILEKLQKRKDFAFDLLPQVLDKYCDEQVARFRAKEDEQAAEALQDQCEALGILLERAQAADLSALIAYIETLFSSEEKEGVVRLSTIHKAKGLEAERVFILAPERLPLLYPRMLPEQRVQEGNLDYVARTRARDTLVYLTTKKFLSSSALPPYAQQTLDDLSWTALPGAAGNGRDEWGDRVLQVETDQTSSAHGRVDLPNLPAPEPVQAGHVPAAESEAEAFGDMPAPVSYTPVISLEGFVDAEACIETRYGVAPGEDWLPVYWQQNLIRTDRQVLDDLRAASAALLPPDPPEPAPPPPAAPASKPPSQVTPLRQPNLFGQYLALKAQYPDCILFYRLGDFYETFDADAEIIARELDLVLTSRPVSRTKRSPMAGVPQHSLDGCIARLLEKGYHVAVAEQLSAPAPTDAGAKGLLERAELVRAVTRTLTPPAAAAPPPTPPAQPRLDMPAVTEQRPRLDIRPVHPRQRLDELLQGLSLREINQLIALLQAVRQQKLEQEEPTLLEEV